MTVMQIGIMRMLVAHRPVPVRVRMRFADRSVMTMSVVRVMRVRMFMLQRLMYMVMLVPLGQMHPQA